MGKWRFAISAALSAFTVAPAFAADLPVKAPVVPVAVYNWTGAYAGVGLGGSSSKLDWVFPAPLAPAGIFGPSTSSTSQRLDNANFSAHIGAQYQWQQFVIGVEGAYNTGTHVNSRASSNCAFPAPFDDRCDGFTPRDIYTVGGRLGYSPQAWDRLLLFVTGGWAQADITTDIRFGSLGGPPPAINRIPITQATTTARGWYVGGGFEYALSRMWWIGAEYQHIELDSTTQCVVTAPPCGGAPTLLDRRITPTIDIARVRLSLRPEWPFLPR